MEHNPNYAFDDEIVSKFCYDMDNKKIEVFFTRYSDLLQMKHRETLCVWTIQNWERAESQICGMKRYEDIDQNIGIFSLILAMEHRGVDLFLTVNTLDGRYINLLFKKPTVSFTILP